MTGGVARRSAAQGPQQSVCRQLATAHTWPARSFATTWGARRRGRGRARRRSPARPWAAGRQQLGARPRCRHHPRARSWRLGAPPNGARSSSSRVGSSLALPGCQPARCHPLPGGRMHTRLLPMRCVEQRQRAQPQPPAATSAGMLTAGGDQQEQRLRPQLPRGGVGRGCSCSGSGQRRRVRLMRRHHPRRGRQQSWSPSRRPRLRGVAPRWDPPPPPLPAPPLERQRGSLRCRRAVGLGRTQLQQQH